MFRSEAIEHATARLEGAVIINPRLSWEVVTFALLALVSLAALFLVKGTYARSEHVTGVLLPSLGVSEVMPSRSGVVREVFVKEGDLVRAGQPLLEVGNEEATLNGDNEADRIVSFLARQERNLETQLALAHARGASEKAALGSESDGLRAELVELEVQIRRQAAMIDKAQVEYNHIQDLVARGFVTKRESEAREDAILTRAQEQQSLRRQLSALRSRITQAEFTRGQRDIETQAEIARLGAAGAELGRSRAEVESRRGYVTVAAIAGRVTAIQAKRGQIADPTQPAMTVIPNGGRLEAQLHVPSVAAGFLHVGQEVRLQIDAFPFQRFGTIPAEILRIPRTVTVPKTAAGEESQAPVYVVTAALDRHSVENWYAGSDLAPGMTLTASIITERRSLLEWIIEPLNAVRKRT